MQANRMPDESSEDVATQQALLALVLAVYPHYRTVPELGREIGDKEGVKRAVDRLIHYGLAKLHGNTVMPTDCAYPATVLTNGER
jgi:superfamily II helicase